jgi:hypothetical protein
MYVFMVFPSSKTTASAFALGGKQPGRTSDLVQNNIREWCACVRYRELVTPYELQRLR